jgi:hypothetical protein
MHPLIPQFLVERVEYLRDPVGRAARIGMSPGFTRMLGASEVAGSLWATGLVLNAAAPWPRISSPR